MTTSKTGRAAHQAEHAPTPDRLPKLCGADVELANFITGTSATGSTGGEASRALLREIDGVPATASRYGATEAWSGGWHGAPAGAQEWGRKFLATTGASAYVDLDHCEVCLPEIISAYDHLAAWHAMLRIVQSALAAANARLPRGVRIHALANNSDGHSNSYGSHLNFLLTRRAWNELFHKKPHRLLYLAAFQASSIVFTGQGKVGSENGRPPVDFQLAQRADFFECLTGVQTTHQRPLVNSRDEALCGAAGGTSGAHMARLHCIFFDSTLCHVSSLLKVGTMQLMLAMIEAGATNAARLLDEPIDAVVRWSHDPALSTRLETASGERLTAVEHQQLFAEDAARFVAAGGADGIVPHAQEIVDLWRDTLDKLAAADLVALAPRLDWVLKLVTLQRALERHSQLDWRSPEIKRLDHLYSSLDPQEGLYWAYEAAGQVERVVDDETIARFTESPPEDTRAWTRAMLLRAAPPGTVDVVDWDHLRFTLRSGRHRSSYQTIELGDPLAFGRAQTEAIFARAASIEEILDGLDELPDAPRAPLVVNHTPATATKGASHEIP